MRKRYVITAIFLCLIVASFVLWRFFGPNTNFTADYKFIYIKTGSSFRDVQSDIESGQLLKNTGSFYWLAKRLRYDGNVKPGKYKVERGMSIYKLLRILRSGKQSPVNLVLTKLRTKEDLAQKIAMNFECDSASAMAIFNNNDSLKAFGLDTNTVMTAVFPNTYTLFWNNSCSKIFRKLYNEKLKFWSEERKRKAASLKLTTDEVYILASIVEEETTKEEDKGKIASVYLNRKQAGMKLAADPTVKFAMRNFGLKRIYTRYLGFPSPYNTYLNEGLPPGPICTPSIKTIDAVLNAPATSYLFFVAKPELNGYSNFSSTFEEHSRYARAYQKALDSLYGASKPY